MRKKELKILEQIENVVSRNAYNKGFTLTKSPGKIYSPYFVIEHCFTGENEINLKNMEPDLSYFYKRLSETNYKPVKYFPAPEKVKNNIAAIVGRKYSVNVTLGTNDFLVNARYFYLLCELLKVENVYTPGTAIDPIFIQGKYGKAFLLPNIPGPALCPALFPVTL